MVTAGPRFWCRLLATVPTDIQQRSQVIVDEISAELSPNRISQPADAPSGTSTLELLGETDVETKRLEQILK